MNHFYESIEGWFNFKEIYDTVLRDAKPGAKFVEVGSWYGRSAAYLAVESANLQKDIELFCVDTWHGALVSPVEAAQRGLNGGANFDRFRKNLEGGGVLDRVKPIVQFSSVAARMFSDESVDFVMIDAAHDFASVRDDVREWIPKLKRGGIMAGDDAGWPGVLIGAYESIPSSEISVQNGGANWLYRHIRPNRGEWTQLVKPSPRSEVLAVIPFVNRPDLLDAAVSSIPALWPSLVVIDQSHGGLGVDAYPWCKKISGIFRVRPGTISFTQMMNWIRAEADDRAVRHVAFMHNDAECREDVAQRVIEFARNHPRAGAVFTNYDAFMVLNAAALKDIGPWDESFQWYFSDNDYYRRLKLRGWECADFGGDSVLHHTSQTLRSDPAIGRQVEHGWRWHEDHYRHKWGGPPGAENFLIPYNGIP